MANFHSGDLLLTVMRCGYYTCPITDLILSDLHADALLSISICKLFAISDNLQFDFVFSFLKHVAN